MTKALPDIGLREFLRGGYKQIDEPTVVRWHGKPVGVWSPVVYDATSQEARTPPTLNRVFYNADSTSMPDWLRRKGS